MGKFIGIALGAIVAFTGLALLLGFWMWEFFIVLKGTIPVILILGGTLALFAGMSELKDTLKKKKE